MRAPRAILGVSVIVCVFAASAAASQFGRSTDLTPTGGAYGTPQAAVGSDGRTVIAFVQRGALVARVGRAGRLGPAQTLDRSAAEINSAGGDLVAAVGRGGLAAVAWIAAGPPHNTRVLVSIAPPGRRFGPPRWINGRQAAFGLDGVGVDRRGHVLVTWRGFDLKCCDMAPTVYAIGSATQLFTPPRTLPVQHEAGGFGQVIQTPSGGVVITAESDPAAIFALDPSGRKLAPLPELELDASTGVIDAAAGPGGIGVSVSSTDVVLGPYFGADVGAALLPSSGVWSAPGFVPLPASTPTAGMGSEPGLALPSDGSTVLALTIGTRMELALAPRGGTFAAPRVIGQTQRIMPLVPGATDPQIAAFGADAAVSWLRPSGHGLTLDIATQPPTGQPVRQTLGRLDPSTAESLATGRNTAAIAWVSHHHVRVAFASAN